MQIPPSTQGHDPADPSSPQAMVVDKGSITLLLPGSEEKVQKEPSQEEKPEQRATDEASKEGQIAEYSQSPHQDTEMQAVGSIETEKIEVEPSQKEITLRRSDKGKKVVEHTPSSLIRRPLAKHTPR